MAGVDFLGALGAGADIDSNSLVESLVQAERAPRESSINSKIQKSEAEISAYGILKAGLESLNIALQSFNDAKDFAEYSVALSGNETSGGSDAFTISASADATPGITSIAVGAIAAADRWGSTDSYAALDTELNGGSTFTVTHTDSGGIQTTVAVTDTTPQGVVDAINTAFSGITASIVDTGASPGRYKIVVSGALGSTNSFSLATTASSGTTLAFGDRLGTAADASLTVNGVSVTRSTNSINDLIDGVTLNLAGTTASTATLSVSQTTEPIKSRIADLVEVYNAVHTQLDSLSDPDSADELGGVLSGDGGFSNITRQLQQMFSSASSTATDNISYLAEIGVEFDRYGKLEIDNDLLDSALTNYFSDVVSIFSADTNNQSNIGDANRGIAGDAIKKINDLLARDGTVESRLSNLESKISDYEQDLRDLDDRMARIQERYIAQFTAMETAIDQMNSTKEYLKTALENLPFSNKD
jgi:flagellar hook-associated protein 2